MERERRSGEDRYRSLFDRCQVALWEADISALAAALARPNAAGTPDPLADPSQRADEAARLAGMIRIVAANEAALRLFEAPDEGTLCADLAAAFAGDSFAALRDIVAAVARGDRVFATEAAARTRGGKALRIGLKGAVIPDEAGRPVRLVLSAEDVTAARATEERLTESEGRFRSIFERAGDGMMMLDVETKRQIEANATICAMLGYSRDEILGLPVDAVHPAEDMPAVIAALDRQVRGETSLAMDIPMLRKDGSVFYADVNSVPLLYRGSRCLLGVFRDCSGRKDAESELRKSQQLLETVIEAAPT